MSERESSLESQLTRSLTVLLGLNSPGQVTLILAVFVLWLIGQSKLLDLRDVFFDMSICTNICTKASRRLRLEGLQLIWGVWGGLK